MTPRFVFHPAARTELREARDWYERQQRGLGDELGNVIAAMLERIAAHPAAYPTVEGSLRRAVLPRFPYALIYRSRTASPEVIEVLAVFHHRRDPATWQRRAAV